MALDTNCLSTPYAECKQRVRIALVRKLDFTRMLDLSERELRRVLPFVVQYIFDLDSNDLSDHDGQRLVIEITDEFLDIDSERLYAYCHREHSWLVRVIRKTVRGVGCLVDFEHCLGDDRQGGNRLRATAYRKNANAQRRRVSRTGL